MDYGGMRSSLTCVPPAYHKLQCGGARALPKPPNTQLRSKELEQMERFPYETPEIVDTFEALEVMGAAEGQVCGNGSQTTIICAG